MKLHNVLILLVLCSLCESMIFFAKVRSVNTQRDFELSIAKSGMVVAYFYNQKDKNLIRMYEDVSSYQPYNDADIVFLKVNVSRKELSNLVELYGAKNMPAFIFFHHGKPLIDSKGMLVQLTGMVSGSHLRDYINRYYGLEVKQYIMKKEARNDLRLQEENESWKEYFYPRTMNVPSYGPEERFLE